MQLRRALLLFAVVLGLGALAASLAPPPDRSEDRPRPPAQIAPAERRGEAGKTVNLSFQARGRPRTATVGLGRHVVITVSARHAGQVSVEGLGVVSAVTPRSPAQFDLLTEREGRFRVVFLPATASAGRTAGYLVVTA
jgi:hypothetical protein